MNEFNVAHEPEQGTAAWWDARYLGGDIPWDTGVSPPELLSLLQRVEGLGWALDLGCGTGLNTRRLAVHGFTAVGVDLAQSALARGHTAANALGVSAFFCLGDVTNLGFLTLRAALAIDIGCFHATPLERRACYVASLADHLLMGGYYLLYAHLLTPETDDPPHGITPHTIALFAQDFELLKTEYGVDRDRDAVWLLMRRR